MNGRNGGGFSSPPVKVGEELDVDIEAVGEKGDGIAKKNGFVLFVPGVKEGDRVRVKVTKVLRKVGFAEVVGEASEGSAKEEAPQAEGASEEEAPAEEEPSGDTDSFGEEETKEEEPAEEGIESTDEEGAEPAEEEVPEGDVENEPE